MILLAAVLTLLAPNGKHLESSVAVSGSRAVVAVINTSFPGEIDVFVSADAAFTWSAPMAMPMTVAGKTYRNAFDPTLAVLDDGSFGLAYLVSSNEPIPRADIGDMGLVFVRSADGVTWSEPQLLASGHALFTPLQDKPWLTVDRVHRTAYLVWTRTDPTTFGVQEIVFARSTDRGVTWSAPVAVTPRGSETFGQLGVLSDGTMVMTDFDADTERYVSHASHDSGATFGDAQAIADAVGGNTPGTHTPSPRMPMVAAWRGDLYCTFPARAGVFFAASHDGGKTWSQPLQLGGAAGDALLPSVAVEEATGNVAVAWLDGRDDPNNATLRLYAARSTDGGKSFGAPTPFSPPFAAGGTALGDYNHIASFNNGVYLTTFASAGGYMTAARIDFPPTVRRRAANH